MGECERVHTPNPDIVQDLSEIRQLQEAFNTAIGIRLEGESLRNRSYNPVIDRWRIQRAWASGDSKKVEEEIQHTRENIHTNLKERVQAVETYGKFELRDGKLYSELLPDESFGQIILRGANYRAHLGSLEQEREGIKGELGGWLELTAALDKGVVGTRVISLSPKGRIPRTSYDGNYVDIYEKIGEHEVTRTRISVNFNDEDYLAVAKTFDPEFEEKQQEDGRALDAWYLSHPFVISDNKTKLPPLLHSETAMSPEMFDELYRKLQQTGLIDYYIHVVTRPEIDWRELAKAFNTILNVADKIQDGQSVTQIERNIGGLSVRRNIDYSYEGLRMSRAIAMVGALGTQRVKQVGGGGCPPNRGIDFNELLTNPLAQLSGQDLIQQLMLDNSVGKFGLGNKETWDYHTGDCVVCKGKGIDVGPCNICKDCEKKF